MATVVDTSVLVALIRKRSSGREEAVRAAREEIATGHALVSAVTVAELLIGTRDAAGSERLRVLLRPIPVAPLDEETGVLAGRMGAYARRRGATIPLADLLIAATALRLDASLRTIDSDFVRGREVALEDDDPGEDGELWRALRLEP